jgi:hypothetical protein
MASLGPVTATIDEPVGERVGDAYATTDEVKVG